MKYLEKSFSVPPATLRNDVNTHGQTWEDIFGPAEAQGWAETAHCLCGNKTAKGNFVLCASCAAVR
jgi:hypothetical protein